VVLDVEKTDWRTHETWKTKDSCQDLPLTQALRILSARSRRFKGFVLATSVKSLKGGFRPRCIHATRHGHDWNLLKGALGTLVCKKEAGRGGMEFEMWVHAGPGECSGRSREAAFGPVSDIHTTATIDASRRVEDWLHRTTRNIIPSSRVELQLS
jgi:hypothetical protein